MFEWNPLWDFKQSLVANWQELTPRRQRQPLRNAEHKLIKTASFSWHQRWCTFFSFSFIWEEPAGEPSLPRTGGLTLRCCFYSGSVSICHYYHYYYSLSVLSPEPVVEVWMAQEEFESWRHDLGVWGWVKISSSALAAAQHFLFIFN